MFKVNFSILISYIGNIICSIALDVIGGYIISVTIIYYCLYALKI